MKKKGGAKSKPQPLRGQKWRTVLAVTLAALAAVSLIGSVITRYVRDNVIDTEGYLEIVGPLPQNPAVAAALGEFASEKLVVGTDAENQIKDFLPPKLAPLSEPLTESLQKRINEATQDLVKSSAFETLWTTANKTTHDGMIRLAESEEEDGKRVATAALKLEDLLVRVRERLGLDSLLSEAQKTQAAEVRIELKQNVATLRTTVSAIETAATWLPWLTLLLLASAVLAAKNRRHAFMGIGIMLLALGVSAMLTFSAASSSWFGQITDDTRKAAAEAVYNAFYSNLQMRFMWITVLCAITLILAALAGRYKWDFKMVGPKVQKTKR